jgi:hypothetical protein
MIEDLEDMYIKIKDNPELAKNIKLFSEFLRKYPNYPPEEGTYAM